MKSPKDPRLSDGWRWQLARALLLLSPGVSTQCSPGSARMVTGAECVENLAGLSAVKELKPSSTASGRGQCSVRTSTAAESVVHRKGTRLALYLEPDRFDLQFSTKELTHDVQTPSMLSMLKLRRFAWYFSSAADVSPFFAYSDEPGTMLVWTDADWSGNEMTCRATSAGAVQLESHQTEAWRAIQHVVLLSSAESEFCAVDAPNVDKQDRRTSVNPETRAEDVAERTIQAVEVVPHAIDSVNKEAKCTRKIKEKLLGSRKALQSSTQKASIAHESRKLAEKAIAVVKFAFASPSEPPDKMSSGLDTLENAKECPSDPDTRVLEREAMPRRVRKYGIFTVTGRFVTPWSARAQWSCFICESLDWLEQPVRVTK